MQKKLLSILFCAFVAVSVSGQTTTFTYQGFLKDGSTPASGNYAVSISLWDAETGGAFINSNTYPTVAVVNGVFTVELDFGESAFSTGTARFVEVAVRPAGGATFTTLTPRTRVRSVPSSIQSLNSAKLGGIAANQYVTTSDGGANFILNSTSQQATSNFNISGNGIIGGSLFIGTSSSEDILGVTGRIVSKQGALSPNSAGLALEQNNPNAVNAFVGMQDDNNVGLFGNIGGWGLVMNTETGVTSFKGVGGNLGIGTTTPGFRLDVVGRSRFRQNAGDTGSTNTAGFWFFQNTPNTDRAFVGMETDNSVGFFGTNGGGWGLVMNTQTGRTSVTQLGAAGATPLCRNASNELSLCSSSLRYKNNINRFGSGLDLISRLRPVSFNWLANNQFDFGLVAEEVAAVEPLLATYNDKGEVEGVKYDRLGVVLINAVGEQQKQIEAQQKEIERLRVELAALRSLVCAANQSSAICKP